MVYAFDAGGAVLVALYVASRTLLSMAVTLGITGVSAKVQPGSLLRPITWLRAVFLALAALTAALHGAPDTVIALAAASSSRAAGLALVKEHDTTVESPPGGHRLHVEPHRVVEP